MKYRELHESHKRQSQRKKEQSKILDEQKLIILKLKKKVKLQKEKLKKLQNDVSPVRSEHARVGTKMNKSYKSFVRTAEEKQRSQRKVVPSDFRPKSKSKKHRL